MSPKVSNADTFGDVNHDLWKICGHGTFLEHPITGRAVLFSGAVGSTFINPSLAAVAPNARSVVLANAAGWRPHLTEQTLDS